MNVCSIEEQVDHPSIGFSHIQSSLSQQEGTHDQNLHERIRPEQMVTETRMLAWWQT
jgi:hypothetical protein